MKTPQIESRDDAKIFAAIVRTIVPRSGWTEQFAMEVYDSGSNAFQAMVEREWEFTWTNEQCSSIAVAYRLTK